MCATASSTTDKSHGRRGVGPAISPTLCEIHQTATFEQAGYAAITLFLLLISKWHECCISMLVMTVLNTGVHT
jgi:hypothetical protein